MKFTTVSSLCFCLIFFAPLPSFCFNLYESVCDESRGDAIFCKNILVSDPKIVSAKNYLDLSRHILEMTIEKAQYSQRYVASLSNQYPDVQCFRQCANEFYTQTVSLFQNSLKHLDNNPGLAKDEARNAGIGSTKCENALQAEQENSPPIHSLNLQVTLLSLVANLSINHHMHG
jgi:hypothetical protein